MLRASIKFYFGFLLCCLFISTSMQAQKGSVTVNQDKQIDQLLALKKDVNKKAKNYKIQVYNGSYSGAQNAETNFYKYFSGWSVSTQYETPNYKVWVGNFKTRLEADRALIRVKRRFPNAFYLKPKKDK